MKKSSKREVYTKQILDSMRNGQLSISEISRKTGIPFSTVWHYLHNTKIKDSVICNVIGTKKKALLKMYSLKDAPKL